MDAAAARRSSARRGGFGACRAHAEDAEGRRGAGGFPRARRRCRRGRRLWPDPAEADPRRAAARLLQPACLAAAALARRRADQPRHHGGRRRDRRHGDADGRRARHRRHGDGRARADRRRHDRRRTARCAGAARRRPDGRALAALERGSLQLTPQPADGVTYAAKIDKAETRIDWTKPWKEVHDHIRGLSPFPGAWFELGRRAGARCCARPKARAAGAPGTVLDDKLTIACGEGAVRLAQVAARRQASR